MYNKNILHERGGLSGEVHRQGCTAHLYRRDVQVITVKDGCLKGYCFTAQAIRIFSIANIVDVEVIKRVV